jgi:serine/threonine protein phosphatase PrpC
LISAYGTSDTGCVRRKNEDRFLVDEPAGVFLLADGMGGHGQGEVAAELAVRTSHEFLSASLDRFELVWPFGYDYNRTLDENRVVTAVQLANRQIWKTMQTRPECAGMGATIVTVAFRDDRSTIGNVGDSRAYLLRAGQMSQLTRDDSWVGDLVRSGAVTEQAARSHAMRHVLTQAVGSHKDLDVHTSEHQMMDGDVMLLTSDGVHGVMEPATMADILGAHSDPRVAAEKLVLAVRENGAPDNATCIVLRYRRE